MSEPEVTHVLALPSGHTLESQGSEIDLQRLFLEHASAAIVRGECPLHATPLKELPAKAGHTAGKCAGCIGQWHRDDRTGDVDWSLAVSPYSVDLGYMTGGELIRQDWMP